MSEFPWFRFFPQDWLAGTSELSAAERGIYITIIAVIYDRGGPIQRNDIALARRCGLPKAGFVRALEALIDAGKLTIKDGLISNDRAEMELVERQKHSATQTKRAQSRWQKTKEKQQPKNAQAMPEPCQSQSQSHITPLPPSGVSPTPKQKRASRLPEDWVLPERFREAARAKGLSDCEIDRQAAKILNWSLSSKAGAKIDWFRAWLNWIDDCPRQSARGSPNVTQIRRGGAAYLLMEALKEQRSASEENRGFEAAKQLSLVHAERRDDGCGNPGGYPGSSSASR